jgi:hypothetical protein
MGPTLEPRDRDSAVTDLTASGVVVQFAFRLTMRTEIPRPAGENAGLRDDAPQRGGIRLNKLH